MNSNTIYNVTQISNTLNHFITQKFTPLFIKGEVSNFKLYPSGHAYFILKDNSSEIKCVFFNYLSSNQNSLLAENIELVGYGELSFYRNRGQIQFIVSDIHVGSTGKLWTKYLFLKNKLTKEGLFENKYKKEIPFIPQRIGIICSASGSVIHDITNILKRRSAYLDLTVFDTPVQGNKAAASIMKLINSINESESVDMIIIARGGGSIEDLQVFNEEELIRSVFKSKIPLISAIGHESDFTLLDLVSDYRASTPSEAAEICAPKNEELLLKIDSFHESLFKFLKDFFYKKNIYLNSSYLRLSNKNPKLKTEILNEKLIFYFKALNKSLTNKVLLYKNKINHFIELFDSKDISYIKEKGFALIKYDSNFIKSISLLNIGDSIDLELKDGSIKAIIKEIYEEK